jgi:hypothetical protein
MQQDHLERSSLLSVEISICIAGRMKINIKEEEEENGMRRDGDGEYRVLNPTLSPFS